jgi:predicted metal-dependent hydrolase
MQSLPAHTVRLSERARRVRVQVGPAGVVLVVPRRVSLERAQAFLVSQGDWIQRQLARQQAASALRAARRPPPGAFRWRGEVLAPTVVEDPDLRFCARVSLHEGRPRVQVPPGRADLAPRVLWAWLQDQARSTLAARVAARAPAMGVRPARIQLRDQRSRWGSCSRRGTLSFNWRIILAPPEVLDYLVVHELAHLAEHNHGPRFWALVAQHDPDFQAHQRWLRDHAEELFQLDLQQPCNQAAAGPQSEPS